MKTLKALEILYLADLHKSDNMKVILHQTLAQLMFKDIRKQKHNLTNLMYFQAWFDDSYYYRRSAILSALFIRKYLRRQEELNMLRAQHTGFWRRQRLRFKLWRLRHKFMSVYDIMHYACYLYTERCHGTFDEFFNLCKDVLRRPELYFEK